MTVAPAATWEAMCSMVVRDLTESFIEHAVEHKDLTSYEARFPELFEHYFAFYGPRRTYPEWLTAEAVRASRDLITAELPTINNRFASAGLDVSQLEVVLLVGQNFSNGHAFLHRGRFIVWLPVEEYRSSLSVRVFVPHEIAHALHYQRSPDFWFDNVESRNHVGRQLVAEGVATLVSMEIAGIDVITALWADYVPSEWAREWIDIRMRRQCELAALVLNRFDESPDDNGLFVFTGKDDGSVFRNRTGYFLGMEVVKTVGGELGLALPELLNLTRADWESLAKDVLQRIKGT